MCSFVLIFLRLCATLGVTKAVLISQYDRLFAQTSFREKDLANCAPLLRDWLKKCNVSGLTLADDARDEKT